MGKIKSITLEEGCLNLQLNSKKDVDMYMLELMKKEKYALSCVAKKRSTTTFLYDLTDLISLEKVLSLWIFTIKEAIQFLTQLFQTITQINRKLPIHIKLDTIFYEEDLSSMRFMILPIHEKQNEENDWSEFLYNILKVLQIHKNEYNFGALYYLNLMQWKSCDDILYALEDCLHPSIFTIMLHQITKFRKHIIWQEENKKRMKEYLDHQRFLRKSEEDSNNKEIIVSKGDTVELFQHINWGATLKDATETIYEVSSKTYIGRSMDCQIQLNSSTVSAKHAVILKKDNRYIIQDLNSSNGTFVNGIRVKEDGMELKNLDEIAFAKEHLWIQIKQPNES